MKKYILDIETNGLYDEVTKCHCIVLHDIDNKKYLTYNSKLNNIKEGLKLIEEADVLVGHNILGYDLPVLEKLYGALKGTPKVIDTLVLARLVFPHIAGLDYSLFRSKLPNKKLMGSQSLKAWGYRLGVLKGDFGETADWSEWTQEMEDYCKQDVNVTTKLYEFLDKRIPNDRAADIELRFAALMTAQERYGFKFNINTARSMMSELIITMEDVKKELQTIFPPKIIQLKTKTKEVPFNPGSGKQVAEALMNKYNWVPTHRTDKGAIQITEYVLSTLDYPEAALLIKYTQLQKIIGLLSEGPHSWIRYVKQDGRIHGCVNSCGTITGRCSHSRPNLAQVPSGRSDLGKKCRALFTVPTGSLLVGVDASGLELRCLAHYLHKFDDGAFTKLILEGDIHTENQKAFECKTRDEAKTAIYAMIYGCSPKKLATILGRRESEGNAILAKYFRRFPQMKQLIDSVKTTAKNTGYLIGLDERKLHVRSEHSALNMLLQSAGAIIMKVAALRHQYLLKQNKLVFGKDYANVANIHDEFQIEVGELNAQLVADTGVRAIQDTTKILKLKCKLDGEAKIGNTWNETH